MKCPYPITIRAPNQGLGYKTKYIAVPCGKCGICLKNQVTTWKIRIKEECKKNIANCFVTLTYSDEHLPSDGVSKRDIQLFIKKLRHEHKFRYYLISEYGPETFRPHYHAIFFGLDEVSFPGQTSLENIWGKGFCTITPVCPERINYICEYHVTKYNNPDGCNPNFKLLSTKPAIGSNYIDSSKDFHRGINQMYYRQDGYKLSLPRYYKDKLYSPEMRRKASNLNQNAENIQMIKELQKDSKYYQKRWFNTKATIEQYKKRTKNNKFL